VIWRSFAVMSDEELDNVDNEDDICEHADDNDEEEIGNDRMADDDTTKSGDDDENAVEEQAEEVSGPNPLMIIGRIDACIA